LDSESLLAAAYVSFGVGFLLAGFGGAFLQSRILRRRFEHWRTDDFGDLVRLMRRTVPFLFAASLFFLELSSVWKDLPGTSAVLKLVGAVVLGGLFLWIAMAFAAREAAKEAGIERAFRLPVAQALARLEALAIAGKGAMGKVIRHPIARWPIRADLSTPEGVIRVRRSGSKITIVKVLRATNPDLLVSLWEESTVDAAGA
jgi:hypothetical protein